MRELPFMATENIMMSAVKKGGDRQDLHERIREHSLAAAKRVKEEGLDNDLLDRIEADPAFMLGRDELDGVLEPEKYTGRAPQQVTEFVDSVVKPILDANRSVLGEKPEVNV
jgi:adenylosuccinate lyase